MSDERFSLARLSFLEKENYDLRVKLDQALTQINCIRKKHTKLRAYSKMLEDFIDNINHKILKLKGKKSPLLENVDDDEPEVVELGSSFEEEWIAKHPKPILHADEDDDEDADDGYDIDPFFNTERFSDFGMNRDDESFDSLNYYFSDEQMEEINEIIGPHLEEMKKKPLSTDSSVSYDARKNAALKVLNNLNLKDELRTAIEEFGWQKIYISELSTIIPTILEGRDVIIEDPVQPNLHLCKIATLVIAILQQIQPSLKCCQALIVVPYRELAKKIHGVVKALGKHMHVTSYVCIGLGTRLRQEFTTISTGVHLVIGTPVPVLDLIKRRTLTISNIKFLAFGDAAELLKNDLAYPTKTIFLNLPEDKQVVVLTSGGCNQEVIKWCNSFMKIQNTIPIKEIASSLAGVKQYYLNINYRDVKWRPLMDIRHHYPNMRMVVICNSHKRIVEWISYQMRQKGETILAADASMKPDERELILEQFAAGHFATLITTELVLRFEDISLKNVALLINYDLPIMPQNYYDRISFCGSDFENRGLVINFVTGKNQTQLQLLNKIAQFCDSKIIELPISVED